MATVMTKLMAYRDITLGNLDLAAFAARLAEMCAMADIDAKIAYLRLSETINLMRSSGQFLTDRTAAIALRRAINVLEAALQSTEPYRADLVHTAIRDAFSTADAVNKLGKIVIASLTGLKNGLPETRGVVSQIQMLDEHWQWAVGITYPGSRAVTWVDRAQFNELFVEVDPDQPSISSEMLQMLFKPQSQTPEPQ